MTEENASREEQRRKIMVELGRSGGNATKEKYGQDHFRKIGKLGMEQRWCKHERKTEFPDGIFVCNNCGREVKEADDQLETNNDL